MPPEDSAGAQERIKPRNLTDVYLRSVKPPPPRPIQTASGDVELQQTRLEIRDTRVKGLVFRLTSKGVASWSLRTRVKATGKQTRVSLGTYPATGLSDARDAAMAALAAVHGGADPVADKQASRAEHKERQEAAVGGTVAARLSEWQAARSNDLGKPWSTRHAYEVARVVKADIPPTLLSRILAETDRADWTAIVARKRKQTPAGAALVYRTISSFLGHAEASGWIATPLLPRKGAAMLAPAVAPRERVLSDKELLAVWRAADREAPKLRAFIRLLILTGAREIEVADITTGEIALADSRWTIPGSRSKNRRAITLPLPALAKAELSSIWPNAAPGADWHLLGRGGRSGFRGFSRLKERIDAASSVAGWRFHDLRRTCRTGMGRLGVDPRHAELALNHVSARSGLERTYDRHDYADEIIAALTCWQEHVASIVAATPAS